MVNQCQWCGHTPETTTRPLIEAMNLMFCHQLHEKDFRKYYNYTRERG